jgi:hypothetical protein
MKSQEVGGVNVRLPHICKKCGKALTEDGKNFPTRWSNGNKYYRFLCRICFNKHNKRWKPRHGMTEGVYERRKQTLSTQRYKGEARHVTNDCKSWDKRHGFACDLDRNYVAALISTGCRYCGVTQRELRIGLDRLDNMRGHLKSNVIPCCTRCNIVRGNMPYKAWLLIADTMRKVRELGLFADWVPGNKSKDYSGVV